MAEQQPYIRGKAGRQKERKKKEKKNLFFRDKWSGDTHLLAPHVWFALFLCFTLWFDEKNRSDTRAFVQSNYKKFWEITMARLKRCDLTKKRLRVQFLMSNDNLFSVKLQWAQVRNLKLQWCLNCAFFLHIVIWQKKFGKMQWADDANRFKHLNNQTTGILQNTSAVV